jgi:hypothetical protein
MHLDSSLLVLPFFLQHSLDLPLVVVHLLVQFLARLLKLSNFYKHLSLSLLSLEGFPHAIGNGTFIESLESLDGHFYFVSDSNEEESSLSAVDRYLPDQLVESL